MVVLDRMTKKGLLQEVTLEQRGEMMMVAVIWGKHYSLRVW